MKKLFTALFVIAAITLSSCGGTTKPETVTTDEVTITEPNAEDKSETKLATTKPTTEPKIKIEEIKEVVAEEVEAVDPTLSKNTIIRYTELVNKYIETAKKAKNKDLAAVASLAKQTKEINDFRKNNETAITNLSESDKVKFQEMAAKLAEAMK